MFGMEISDLIPVMAAASAFIAVVSIWRVSIEYKSPLAKKAKELLTRENAMRRGYIKPEKRGKILQNKRENIIRKVVTKLNLMKSAQAERMEARLAQAGWRGKEMLMNFLFVKLCMPFVGGGFALIILWLKGGETQATGTQLLIVLAGVFVGYYLPELMVKNKVAKRRLALELALPDSLDLMVICAEAGLSLEATLKRVAVEMALASPELSDELALTATELGILPERRKALENLVVRTDMPQIKSVVNTLLQAERYGTPLAQSLVILGEEYRSERMMKAEEKAAKLPAILTVPMIVFIMPSLFIVLLGPAIMQGLDSISNM
ncbi:type II secretion system F family protein [Curvivirga aplysinae]|uniref:type II secretion system F family protein n=1 Tax=Curvivirga aplysinae TaxID=2529852 RepID=UPI0012BCA137|nr:type II secretion system F family protein [Curvivirga aplysinae]MTI08633.1 type II secretion system F family protein [Curvivirga aplysinae]